MLYKDAFIRGAKLYPNRDCVIDGERRFTFRQCHNRWNRFSNALIKLGVKKGDRLGVILKNSVEIFDSYAAGAIMGTVVSPVNFRLPASGIKAILQDQQCTVLLVDREFLDIVNSIKSDLGFIKNFICVGANAPGYIEYESLIKTSSTDDPDVEFSPDDPAVIIYTTGTTGEAKGALATRQIQLYRLIENSTELKDNYTDVYLNAMPLFHIGVNVSLGFLYRCASNVMQRDWDPKEFCRLVQEEKVTKVTMAPALINFVVNWPDTSKYDLSSLKLVFYGAAPMPLETLMRGYEVLHGTEFQQGYGSSESFTAVMLYPEEHQAALNGGDKEKKRLRAAGRQGVLSFAKIVDDYGNDVKPGEIGEILLGGGMIFKEYWNRPEATAKALKDGWFHTGDLGTLDEKGYIYLIDRKNFMIITGGENVYPNQVENVLFSHPKIAQAAVLGVPDKTWGEIVKAVIVLQQGQTSTAEEIIDYCRDKIANYAKPKVVEFTKALPMTPMGKVDKPMLKQIFGNPV